MPKLDHDTLELLLIAVTAICILFQTILLSAMFIAVRKGIKSLTENVDDLRASAMPVIDHTRGFVERITPRVEETAKNVAEMSQTLNAEPKVLCYPRAALFGFCLGLVAANAVALLKAVVRAEHGERSPTDCRVMRWRWTSNRCIEG